MQAAFSAPPRGDSLTPPPSLAWRAVADILALCVVVHRRDKGTLGPVPLMMAPSSISGDPIPQFRDESRRGFAGALPEFASGGWFSERGSEEGGRGGKRLQHAACFCPRHGPRPRDGDARVMLPWTRRLRTPCGRPRHDIQSRSVERVLADDEPVRSGKCSGSLGALSLTSNFSLFTQYWLNHHELLEEYVPGNLSFVNFNRPSGKSPPPRCRSRF